MKNIIVDLENRSYRIHIESGCLETCASLDEVAGVRHALVITDENVAQHYENRLVEHFRARGIATNSFIVAAGEKSKSIDTLNEVWNWIESTGATRQTSIVALGGGVVGDLAGFAAATYARGISLIQVPTSLLAQVDSSVGGKTGINLPTAKNKVGAFWQPLCVVIDPQTLDTLDAREFVAGMAEVVKYGVIMDAEFFDWLESNASLLANRDANAIEHAIATCCRLKAAVVASDERETQGHRVILNYGHTFAHALEAYFEYGRMIHGEAVSVGMVMASGLAHRLDRVDREFCIRQKTLLESLGLPTSLENPDARGLLDLMAGDKKRTEAGLQFVLPTRLGHVELVSSIDPRVVIEVIESHGDLT